MCWRKVLGKLDSCDLSNYFCEFENMYRTRIKIRV